MYISGNIIPKWLAMKTLASFTHYYAPGEIIFHEGDPGTTAFIIEKGKVEVSITRNNEKLLLAVYDSGDLFGEMALIDETPRSATVMVLEPTEVIAIERSQFDKAFDKAHPLVNLFMHTILHNLRKTNHRLLQNVDLQTSPAGHKRFNDKFLDARNETVYLVKAENELTRALNDNEFQLYLQPIVDVLSGTIQGFESLIRWQHPQRGLVPPNEFISLAEQTGLIKPMGEWIIHDAFRQLRVLSSEIPELLHNTPDFFISINLSAKQFIYPDLFSHVMDTLKQHNIASHHVKFEITESILMDNPETALLILNKFKQEGFRIAIDDFGTGYSSLSYLHSFPIDTLKIDRSFINSMQENATSLNIVHAIISLAKAIGLNLIAEGVETEQQLQNLQYLECDSVQGYYFYKPMPFAEALELLKNKSCQ